MRPTAVLVISVVSAFSAPGRRRRADALISLQDTMIMDARVYLTKKDRYAGTRKDAALFKKYRRAPLFRGGFTLCALAAAAPCVAAMGLPNSGSSGISNVREAPRVMGWGVLFVLASAVHAAEIAITTLWPWKVREFAEEEGKDSPFMRCGSLILYRDIWDSELPATGRRGIRSYLDYLPLE